MFLHRAMRYYRLWIYSCNLALLVSVIAFVILAAWVLTDFRMALFPSIRLHQPSLLYAYLALALQGGLLQAVGCFGALKMNEKLLNVYWTLMLVLLLGDVVVGIVWLFRFQYLSQNLKDDLRSGLQEDYGTDPVFQLLWDRVQTESMCCGVSGPQDFNSSSWVTRLRLEYPQHRQLVPRSCCRMYVTDKYHGEIPVNASCVESYQAPLIYAHGCYDAIRRWLQKSAHLLSVLGFCVITFLKLCFLGILRYEIREMIQKIKILRGMGDPTCVLDTSFSAKNLRQASQTSDKPPNGNNNDSEPSPLKRSCPV